MQGTPTLQNRVLYTILRVGQMISKKRQQCLHKTVIALQEVRSEMVLLPAPRLITVSLKLSSCKDTLNNPTWYDFVV